MSAAFGAPLGGVLFALEEGASFWNQQLVVRIFFCSLISSFSLNFIVSVVSGQKLGASGLLNFGKFQDIDYSWFEMPIYAAMGAFGGLTGAAWNYLNMKITILRMRYLRSSWSKVAEAVVASLLTASIGFLMIILLGDCYSLKTEETEYPVGYGCPKGEKLCCTDHLKLTLLFGLPHRTAQCDGCAVVQYTRGDTAQSVPQQGRHLDGSDVVHFCGNILFCFLRYLRQVTKCFFELSLTTEFIF